MARPPPAMVAHGSMSVTKQPGSATYVARCRFRDFDGVTRSLERAGRSKAAAMAALQDELRSRVGTSAAPLRPHHTFARAAEAHLATFDAQVGEGTRAATTADTYRQRLRSVVLPAIGQWQLREAPCRSSTRSSQTSRQRMGPRLVEMLSRGRQRATAPVAFGWSRRATRAGADPACGFGAPGRPTAGSPAWPAGLSGPTPPPLWPTIGRSCGCRRTRPNHRVDCRLS
jgi:hypothetical protein